MFGLSMHVAGAGFLLRGVKRRRLDGCLLLTRASLVRMGCEDERDKVNRGKDDNRVLGDACSQSINHVNASSATEKFKHATC